MLKQNQTKKPKIFQFFPSASNYNAIHFELKSNKQLSLAFDIIIIIIHNFNKINFVFPVWLVLRKAFDMFDRDKKGYIHTNMVSTILRTLGQTFEENDLQQLIIEIDADGNINKKIEK